jgi:hypothetical protein
LAFFGSCVVGGSPWNVFLQPSMRSEPPKSITKKKEFFEIELKYTEDKELRLLGRGGRGIG